VHTGACAAAAQNSQRACFFCWGAGSVWAVWLSAIEAHIGMDSDADAACISMDRTDAKENSATARSAME
jgi:hypothetical protein